MNTTQTCPFEFIFVDDDPINNLICEKTVDAVFGNVPRQSFTNPKLALEHLTAMSMKDGTRPTILFLDINMPIMTGWEFLDRFDYLPADLKKSIRLYILSSSVDDRDKERTYANRNVLGFIVKPLMKEILEHVVEQLVAPGKTNHSY